MSTFQRAKPRFGGPQRQQQQRQRRDNDLVVFANERKRSDRDPDYTGQGLVGGIDHWVSMWVKRSKKTGEEFFSLSLRPKDEQRKQEYSQQEEPRGRQNGGPSYFQRASNSRQHDGHGGQGYQDENQFIPEFGNDWERES